MLLRRHAGSGTGTKNPSNRRPLLSSRTSAIQGIGRVCLLQIIPMLSGHCTISHKIFPIRARSYLLMTTPALTVMRQGMPPIP